MLVQSRLSRPQLSRKEATNRSLCEFQISVGKEATNIRNGSLCEFQISGEKEATEVMLVSDVKNKVTLPSGVP